jgi:peptidoglycan/LPS O-acetylase OafA/YrhL
VLLGYEVSLFPLYLISIAALSWRFEVVGGVISVCLATGLWYYGNVLTGVDYTYDWAIYYNTGARAAVFVMASIFLIIFKRVVEQHRRRMEAMRALLNVCHGCGSVQGSDGRWIPFDQLRAPKERPVCECPECARISDERRISRLDGSSLT